MKLRRLGRRQNKSIDAFGHYLPDDLSQQEKHRLLNRLTKIFHRATTRPRSRQRGTIFLSQWFATFKNNESPNHFLFQAKTSELYRYWSSKSWHRWRHYIRSERRFFRRQLRKLQIHFRFIAQDMEKSLMTGQEVFINRFKQSKQYHQVANHIESLTVLDISPTFDNQQLKSFKAELIKYRDELFADYDNKSTTPEFNQNLPIKHWLSIYRTIVLDQQLRHERRTSSLQILESMQINNVALSKARQSLIALIKISLSDSQYHCHPIPNELREKAKKIQSDQKAMFDYMQQLQTLLEADETTSNAQVINHYLVIKTFMDDLYSQYQLPLDMNSLFPQTLIDFLNNENNKLLPFIDLWNRVGHTFESLMSVSTTSKDLKSSYEDQKKRLLNYLSSGDKALKPRGCVNFYRDTTRKILKKWRQQKSDQLMQVIQENHLKPINNLRTHQLIKQSEAELNALEYPMIKMRQQHKRNLRLLADRTTQKFSRQWREIMKQLEYLINSKAIKSVHFKPWKYQQFQTAIKKCLNTYGQWEKKIIASQCDLSCIKELCQNFRDVLDTHYPWLARVQPETIESLPNPIGEYAKLLCAILKNQKSLEELSNPTYIIQKLNQLTPEMFIHFLETQNLTDDMLLIPQQNSIESTNPLSTSIQPYNTKLREAEKQQREETQKLIYELNTPFQDISERTREEDAATLTIIKQMGRVFADLRDIAAEQVVEYVNTLIQTIESADLNNDEALKWNSRKMANDFMKYPDKLFTDEFTRKADVEIHDFQAFVHDLNIHAHLKEHSVSFVVNCIRGKKEYLCENLIFLGREHLRQAFESIKLRTAIHIENLRSNNDAAEMRKESKQTAAQYRIDMASESFQKQLHSADNEKRANRAHNHYEDARKSAENSLNEMKKWVEKKEFLKHQWKEEQNVLRHLDSLAETILRGQSEILLSSESNEVGTLSNTCLSVGVLSNFIQEVRYLNSQDPIISFLCSPGITPEGQVLAIAARILFIFPHDLGKSLRWSTDHFIKSYFDPRVDQELADACKDGMNYVEAVNQSISVSRTATGLLLEKLALIEQHLGERNVLLDQFFTDHPELRAKYSLPDESALVEQSRVMRENSGQIGDGLQPINIASNSSSLHHHSVPSSEKGSDNVDEKPGPLPPN